jgi:ABC-2 type transport system permease protein
MMRNEISWSLRRELWENRFLYIAPLIVTAVVLFGSLVTVMTLPHRMERIAPSDRASQKALVQYRATKPMRTAPAPIMLTTLLVGFFYAADAFYGERRDRSILFWKSLPVSDAATVLTKAAVPLVVLPAIALTLSLISLVALSPLTAAVLLGKGADPNLQFFELVGSMFYGLTAHILWYAPIYAWVMLISAWTRRAPLLWAVMPVVVLSVLERIAFNTSYFVSLVQYRVTGAMKEAFEGLHTHDTQLTPLRFLTSPGLWLGLLFAAACFAVIVKLRRRQEPI